MPALSVLVPVRDARPWIAASFASLSRQTFRDLEIVAVDDGSRDGSGEWLERHTRHEPRLSVIRTARRGLPAALATALAAARAPMVARHDADDLSHRHRFARQMAYLAAHRGVAVVGTRVRLFPAGATGPGMRRWAAWHDSLIDHRDMRNESLIDSVLAHGTATMRRRALEDAGGWVERGWPEDMDLWRRLLERGASFAKLPERLYGWRQHAGSATRTDPRYRRERFDALRLEALIRGPLAGARTFDLVGVGQGLTRWQELLTGRDRVPRVHVAGHPSDTLQSRLRPPVVLVFGAAPARVRWRAALVDAGLSEWRDFIFVA
ncbi:MAG: glycosyltransferase family 2 protein [Candidatus Eisenbacteria bacterium]